jgi:hypothetical protein
MERSLRWEPNAANQVGKTRVRPQRVPEWFHFKVAETTGALLVSLFEPREGLILLTKCLSSNECIIFLSQLGKYDFVPTAK